MSIFGELVPVDSIRPINAGLHSATEETMISLLGSPRMPLTTQDQPERASQLVTRLRTEKRVDQFHLDGVAPAVESLVAILARVKADNAALYAALGSDGMLVVRLRRPTNGKPSKLISNHAWGTAIDFTVDGHASGDTKQQVPRGIALLVPYLNATGWYSGIGFHDDMHFEVADETIHAWAKAGKLTPAAAVVGG